MSATENGPPYVVGRDFYVGERVEYRNFTCARCGEQFMTPTTEVEANREYLASGQRVSTGISSVCDDCYEYIMERAKEVTNEQRVG